MNDTHELARLRADMQWLSDNAPLAIWRGHHNGKVLFAILETNLDGETTGGVLGEGPTLHDAIDKSQLPWT